MNGWDLFSWFNALVLTVTALLIFAYLLRDAREALLRQRSESDE